MKRFFRNLENSETFRKNISFFFQQIFQTLRVSAFLPASANSAIKTEVL